jgi:methionine-rich copper-binding protein CopC
VLTVTTSPHSSDPFKTSPSKGRTSLAGVLSAGVLLAAALSVLPAAPASAHSALLSTDPADGATLSTAPEQVSLVFNEDVAPQFVDGAITVGTVAATPVTATVDAGTVVLAVPDEREQAPGAQAWRVDYRVVSADGHPISGSLTFTVEAITVEAPPLTAVPVVPPTTTAPAAPEPSPSSGSDSASASTSTEAGAAETGQGGGGSSVIALSTGLAAVVGAIVGTVIVLVRRRRQRS